MKFTVLTLFPELFEIYLSQTIIQRAKESRTIGYDIINIRDYSTNRHGQMDDIPFGGGAGMVLKPEAYWNYFERNTGLEKPYVIFVSPQGTRLNHKKVDQVTHWHVIPHLNPHALENMHIEFPPMQTFLENI